MTPEVDMADIEDRTMEKAEEMAQKQYCLSFETLPPYLQMRVWMEAEQEVTNELANRAETFWDELELEKRNGN